MLTPKKKRILVTACLVIVAVLAILIIALISRNENPQSSESIRLKPVPESFTFAGVGSTTRLTRDIRKRLSEKFGSGGIEKRGIIDLTLQPRGLLEKQFKPLYRLHRELSSDLGARVEHNITLLTFRYPWKKNNPMKFVQLVFSNDTGRPLYFRVILKKEGSAIIETLGEKYGLSKQAGPPPDPETVLYWEKNGDKLVVSRRTDRFGDPEYHVMFYFVNSLNQLLSMEQKSVESKEAELKKAGKTAF